MNPERGFSPTYACSRQEYIKSELLFSTRMYLCVCVCVCTALALEEADLGGAS
jgi:hypothetical protein